MKKKKQFHLKNNEIPFSNKSEEVRKQKYDNVNEELSKDLKKILKNANNNNLSGFNIEGNISLHKKKNKKKIKMEIEEKLYYIINEKLDNEKIDEIMKQYQIKKTKSKFDDFKNQEDESIKSLSWEKKYQVINSIFKIENDSFVKDNILASVCEENNLNIKNLLNLQDCKEVIICYFLFLTN